MEEHPLISLFDLGFVCIAMDNYRLTGYWVLIGALITPRIAA
jgi:hypothetical protein